MVLVVVFSQYCISSIKLDITALMLLCVVIGMCFEAVRWRGNFDKASPPASRSSCRPWASRSQASSRS